MAVEWEDLIDSIQLDVVLEDLGISVISIVRGEHWASCQLPTHPSSDHKPSFSVNEDTLLWNCFTCNEGGTLPRLVALTLGFEGDADDTPYDKGVEWLIPYSDVDPDGDNDDDFLKQTDRYLDRLEERTRLTRSTVLPTFNKTVFDRHPLCPVELLAKWHVYEEETVANFGIRYVEDRPRSKGGKEYVGPAIVIPHVFRGKIVGYQERWIGDDVPKWIPKYTNSDDFPKAQTLFNWDGAVEAAKLDMPVTVVEAAMTVVRLWELGYPGTATFGAGVNAEQIKLLATLRPGVILARDEDPDYTNQKGETIEGAGVKNFKRNADALSGEIPVWTLPPISQEKGDLADLDDVEVERLYAKTTPVFQVQAPSNRVRRSVER